MTYLLFQNQRTTLPVLLLHDIFLFSKRRFEIHRKIHHPHMETPRTQENLHRSKESPRTQGGLLQEVMREAKDSEETFRRHWTEFRSEVMISQKVTFGQPL